jgi:hypothetical protein
VIRTIVQRTLVVTLVTVGSAIASAQPSTVAPVTTPEEPAPYVYPRRVVDRPLLLPEGAFDILLGFALRNDQSTYFAPRATIATPLFELHVGLSYQLGDRPNEDAKLAAFYVGGLRELIPCRVPGLAVGAQLVATRPAGDQPGFSPNLLAYYKRKLASFFAIVPSASLGYDYGQAVDETDDIEGSYHLLDGSLALAAQLQAGRVFAFEVALSASYYQDLGEAARFGIGSHGEQSLSVSVLLSSSDNTDLRFAYSRSMRSAFEFASDGIFFALDIRKI